MKNGGWLNKYNTSEAENGIEGTMAGLTDQGFDYNGAWGGTMQTGGNLPQAQDGMLDRIYSKWPALKKLGNVTIKSDESFTKDKTGVGDIEFFSPNLPQVNYDNGYIEPHPGPGTYGVVYNPLTNNDQNIRLDMLHGMSGADNQYKRLRNSFERSVKHSDINDAMKHWYNVDKEKGSTKDGKKQWIDNYVDGQLRTLLFEGDRASQNYSDEEANELLANPKIKTKFDKLNTYLKKGEFGSSLPGSVGFTYARTQDPAPSNGPYAKKTKASAQNGKDIQKERYNKLYAPIENKVFDAVGISDNYDRLPISTRDFLDKTINGFSVASNRNIPPMDPIIKEVQDKVQKLPKEELTKLLNTNWSKMGLIGAMKNTPSSVSYLDMLKYVNHFNKLKKKGYTLENGGEMAFYQNGLDFTPKSISKNGSVIKDDRGQWEYPGEITKINSNQITMQGVDYPVLGISDTGDTQMMQPGQDYTYDGKSVTEYPMMQDGGLMSYREPILNAKDRFVQKQMNKFGDAKFVNRALEIAEKQGYDYGADDGGPLDAVRHAAMSASVAKNLKVPKVIGKYAPALDDAIRMGAANLMGFGYELSNFNEGEGFLMDMKNNYIGSDIGVMKNLTDEERAKKIAGMLKYNKLSIDNTKKPKKENGGWLSKYN